jgi:hypothetical protein
MLTISYVSSPLKYISKVFCYYFLHFSSLSSNLFDSISFPCNSSHSNSLPPPSCLPLLPFATLSLNSRSFLLSLTNLTPCIPLTFHSSFYSSSSFCTSPFYYRIQSLFSSVLRRVILKINGKTPWMRDLFIARPLQSVQSISSLGLL